MKLYNAYLYGFIFGLGILGNLLSFVVYSRKRFRNTIFNIYFRLYVISDSIVLVQALDLGIMYAREIYVSDYSPFWCYFQGYLFYAACPISAHILVIFAADRYLSVQFPAKFGWRKKNIFQLALASAIVIYNLAVYTDILAVITYVDPNANITNPNITTGCVASPDMAFNVFDSINSSIVPFFFMIIFTSLTIKAIFDSRKRSSSDLSSRDIKFAIVSIGYNAIFIVFTLPTLVYVMALYTMPNFGVDLGYSVVIKFYYANFGMNFYINMAINSIFREEFLNLILFR